MNTTMLLEMVADGEPNRLVLGSGAGSLPAGELLARARGAARRFCAEGAEHVGFVGLNSASFPIGLFGAGLAGLPFAPVNHRLGDEKLGAILRRLVPGVVVVDPEFVDRVGDVDGLRVMTTDELLTVTAPGIEGVGDHPIDEEVPDGLPFVDPDQIAVLLFTSGTTGEPKAAVLRHRHLTSYILSSVDFLSSAETDAQLVSVPPYHVAGISAVLSAIYRGRRIVYLPAFDAATWVRTVRDEQVTHAMVVPTMLDRVLTCLDETGADVSCLRHLSYGGGRMPASLIERAMARLPEVDFVNAYGLTETSSTISVLTPDQHREAIRSTEAAIRRRLSSVGRPLPSIEIDIRDPRGCRVAPGERGEIHVRGEQVAGEYLGRSMLTDEGWFPTNDAGWIDEHGFVFLDGRLDDVIVRGAENLSPGEIEDALASHPAVADAAVVGIPDPVWGETVAAAVVFTPGRTATDDELKTWVRDRLRSTRTPTIISVREELPYNEVGKLLRRVIRQELASG